MKQPHQPVLLAEAIAGLAIRTDGHYIDGTLGRAGHSQAILAQLSEQGILLAVDRDPQAIAYAQQALNAAQDHRVILRHAAFSQLPQLVRELGWYGDVHGVLLDLGISSPQVDDSERGFSFMRAGPLDMRMDNTQSMTAASWLAAASEAQISQVIYEYGEDRYARKIAKAIVTARTQQPITRTEQLADIVKQAIPKWEKHKHPATRTFQALRIVVNDELGELQRLLAAVTEMLAIGGRLVVISFHSLEDRLVKRFLMRQSSSPSLPMGLPITKQQMAKPRFRKVGKAIKPGREEVQSNLRARSAILRIGEKIT
ncbi:MAG: 16S rRNA (cytosine(1402)-N(4))-methyltransferase RsmH [Legionellales bacterium]|nr:16S rRNA (cytosine(1402)-N(4))-methyltransferase RsmH [Legionellales bacterium]